ELARRLRMVLERYLATHPRTPLGATAGADAPMLRWDAHEQARRLRRLAKLMDGASLDRDRLERLRTLVAQMEEELGALAAALDSGRPCFRCAAAPEAAMKGRGTIGRIPFFALEPSHERPRKPPDRLRPRRRHAAALRHRRQPVRR